MFTTHIYPGRVLLQHHQTSRVEIYPFGALLNRYEVAGHNGWFNVIAGYATPAAAEQQITAGFRSAKLSPFACRLKQGSYHFKQQQHHTGSYFVDGHAAHGLLYNAPFQISASGQTPFNAWVELSHHYTHHHPGYPFDYRLQVRYTLSANGLTISTTATNTGNSALPLADGWHPYFTLGGQADDWQLKINSRNRLEFNDQLLPTGRQIADSRFLFPTKLEGQTLDNSYVLEDFDRPACLLQNTLAQLEIRADGSYPLLHVYLPPDRRSIALENLSGAPDCFNNGIGLLTLEPRQSQTFSVRYLLSTKTPAA